LIEHFSALLSSQNIPIYFITPKADFITSYLNICGEWLNKTKQEKLYLPEYPFAFEELIKASKLFLIYEQQELEKFLTKSFKEPCLIFSSHPSLRTGPVLQILKLLKSNPKNSLLLVESEFDPLLLSNPFLPFEHFRDQSFINE
jgi:integrator complex subunit 9